MSAHRPPRDRRRGSLRWLCLLLLTALWQVPRIGLAEEVARAEVAAEVGSIVIVDGERLPDLQGRSEAIEAGQALFEANCRICHGEGGEGTRYGGPNLTDDYWREGQGSYAEILTTVTLSRPATPMPRWRDLLSDTERAQVAAYVYSLRGSNRTGPDSPPPGTDFYDEAMTTDRESLLSGKHTFQVNCTPCHGAHAMGSRYAPNLTDDIWRNLNGSYRDIVSIISLGTHKGMPTWFKRFPAKRIRELAAFVYYLRSCPREFYESCLEPK